MIRVGLVGFGLAGRVFHAPMIHAVEGLELAAVVERSSRNAEAAYPGITTYTSLEAMLGDPTLELIVIGTPNLSHVPQATEALLAGRHVVVDKPVANTSAELAQLIGLAEKQNRFLIPFHNRRWDSDFQTFRKLMGEGSLGRVVSFDSTFDRWRPLPKTGTWREEGGPGTGILLDLGTHLADQALTLFGPPEGVSAEVRFERDNVKANDSFTVRLYYPKLIATLAANCLSAQPRPRYVVRGTEGSFVKLGLDPQEARLKENPMTAGHGEEPESAWGKLTVAVEGELATQVVPSIPGDYRLYYAAVRDAILGKGPVPVAAADALKVAKILEWAEESSATGRRIACDWTS